MKDFAFLLAAENADAENTVRVSRNPIAANRRSDDIEMFAGILLEVPAGVFGQRGGFVASTGDHVDSLLAPRATLLVDADRGLGLFYATDEGAMESSAGAGRFTG